VFKFFYLLPYILKHLVGFSVNRDTSAWTQNTTRMLQYVRIN